MTEVPYEPPRPLDKYLLAAVESVAARVHRGKASIIIFDGGVGEGKTTLAVQVADVIEGSPIVFDEQLAMGAAEFSRKLGECYRKKHKVIIYDEAGDFNRRGALTKTNAQLNRVFETFRAFKIVVIIVLPNFSVLDGELFLKGAARFLVHVHSRDHNSGRFSIYSISRMMVMREKMRTAIVKQRAYTSVPPNCRGRFYDLTPERSRELDLYSTRGKLFELDKAAASMEGLASPKTLRQKLGVPESTFFRTIKQSGLVPERRVGNESYYSEIAVKELFKRKRGEL